MSTIFKKVLNLCLVFIFEVTNIARLKKKKTFNTFKINQT